MKTFKDGVLREMTEDDLIYRMINRAKVKNQEIIKQRKLEESKEIELSDK